MEVSRLLRTGGRPSSQCGAPLALWQPVAEEAGKVPKARPLHNGTVVCECSFNVEHLCLGGRVVHGKGAKGLVEPPWISVGAYEVADGPAGADWEGQL